MAGTFSLTSDAEIINIGPDPVQRPALYLV